MTVARLHEMFVAQAEASERLGSPMYADVCRRCAEDVTAGGPVLSVVSDHLARPPSLTPLRLLGGVHRLVLSRRAPALATWYPSVGGTATDPEQRWAAFLDTCVTDRDELAVALDQPPQTNEVGRSAVLIGALAVALESTGNRPVRLLELGASAGLNLRADRFRVDGRGPVDSPVRLDGAWRGQVVPAADVTVVERRGCDLAPIDPTTTEGRLTLTSYVWPDDAGRLERLRGAFAVAETTPAVVDRASVLDWLREVVPLDGVLTVLWHSVARLYLSEDGRAEWDRLVRTVGARATPEAPVAHVSFEPRRSEKHFRVELMTWPGGSAQVLGTAPPHGLPVTWTLDGP